jgi:flagellar biosynthesis chaperone FliJ
MICKVQEAEASQLSKDGIVPLASGISVENKQEIQRFIGCLESKARQATAEAARLWGQQHDKHASVKTLKQHLARVVNHLIALCIDVYKGSKRNAY